MVIGLRPLIGVSNLLIDDLSIAGLKVGSDRIDLRITRDGSAVRVDISRTNGTARILVQ